MLFEVENQLAQLLRLVRENRLDEAHTVMGQLIGEVPEVTAQWMVLARLLLAEPVRWEGELQQSLGQLGIAPLTAYRQAVKVLDVNKGDGSVAGTTVLVQRLEALLVAVAGYRDATLVATPLITLTLWLDKVRALRAEHQLMTQERCVARLSALADQLSPVVEPPQEYGASQRLIRRLEGLQMAVCA